MTARHTVLWLMLALGCTGGRVSAPAGECTAHYAAFRRPVEIAVLLDRSCAMRERFDGSMASGPDDPQGRWGAVVAALGAVSADPASGAWSLVLSPESPTSCSMSGELSIHPEPYSGELVPEVLGAPGASPFDVCASGAAESPLEAALGVLYGSDSVGSTGDPLVLVVAGGAPGCGSTELSLEEAAASSPYDLVVLALAPDPRVESLALPDESGARPNLRRATSAAEASAHVGEVVRARQSCVLDLLGEPDVAPTDEEALRVWVDGEPLARDPDEGWVLSLDGAITLNGAVCERLRAGEVLRVTASSGCDDHACVAIDPDADGQGEEACDGLDNDCDDAIDEGCV